MAITITQQPYKFTPASNTVIWQINSDSNLLVYFTCTIKETVSGITIQQLDLYPSPNNPTSIYIDLSRILNNYVKYQFKGYSDNLIDSFDTNILGYTLTFVERNLYFTTDGSVIGDGDSLTTTGNYVFCGELNKTLFKNYIQNSYVVNTGSFIKFLTTKPDKVTVNDETNDGLFFLQDNYNKTISVKYSFFSNTNSSIGTYTATLSSTDQTNKKLFRINTSLKTLKEEITGINFTNVSYFTVQLIDNVNVQLSETTTFIIESFPCNLKSINVVWINEFGVLETYQFVNPENSLSITRNTTQKNPNKEAGGIISNFTESSFNVIDEVLTVNSEQSIKVNTRVLGDDMLKWISGILKTKQAWVQVEDNLFVPALVNDTSITLTEQRYLTEPNIKQFTLKLSDVFSW